MSASPDSLQVRLEAVPPDQPTPPEATDIADPVGLLRHLEASGRFHRDHGFGRVFHPGRASFRENRSTESLHIVVHHNRITAHVDLVSPLGLRPQRRSRYSLRRAVAHNLVGMAQDLIRLRRGRQGDHRSQLDCEWQWSSGTTAPEVDGLLDPTEAAWSVQVEARAGGRLDERRLRAAVAATLGSATGAEVLDVADCPDDHALDAARSSLQSLAVAVTDRPPMQARLARHPDGDVVMLNLNHAACDGIGALAVLRSIARSYRAGPAGAPGPVPVFLAATDLPVRPASGTVSAWQAAGRAAAERARDLLARPVRLAPDHPAEVSGYGFHHLTMPAEETGRMVDVTRPGTTRNVLLAALHLAVGQWNLEHGRPGGRIGVLAPVNLRPAGWHDETVANLSVTARVSTTRRQRAGPEIALRAITAQTVRNKRTRTGIALVAALQRAGLLALWAKQSLVVLQPLTRNRLVDTALLAYLGEVPDPPFFGDAPGPMPELWFSVPARSPVALCIGAVRVEGRLHLVLRYPRRLLSAEAAGRFADCYRAMVLEVADSRPSALRPDPAPTPGASRPEWT